MRYKNNYNILRIIIDLYKFIYFFIGNGFFLYSTEQLIDNEKCNIENNIEDNITKNNGIIDDKEYIEEDTDTDTPVQIIIVSLWYWW